MFVPKRRRVIALDVETTGLEPYRDTCIFAWATCSEEGTCHVRRIPPRRGYVDEYLQNLLIDRSIELVAHNAKFERAMLSVHGYRVPDTLRIHDTMIQAMLLDNRRDAVDLGTLGEEFLDWPQDLDKRISSMAREYGGYYRVPEHDMDAYQRADVQRTMLLHQGQYAEIQKNVLLNEDYLNELELIRVTQRMEQRGICLDTARTEKLILQCDKDMASAVNDLYACTHERINIGSSRQIEWLLFTQLGYRHVPNTRQDSLDILRNEKDHPVFDCILRYRTYQKAAGTMRGYLKRAIDGKLHPNIRTNGAKATGRESCDNPNLQNVGKSEKQSNPYMVPMRSCFIPSPGRAFILSDESGIEIRLGIDAARCKGMITGMRAGIHPHVLAIRAFLEDDTWKKIKKTKQQYDTGKNGHFALMYGAGHRKVVDTLGYGTLEGVQCYIERYPEIAFLVRNGIQRVKKNQYKVITPFGRELRVIPQEVYAWLNYMIQGTAAGIIKRAQVSAEALRGTWGNAIQLILPIHDEIIHEIDTRIADNHQELDRFLCDVDTCMTVIPHITVPLEAEHKIARIRWSEAVEVKRITV